jgi:phytoene synthase
MSLSTSNWEHQIYRLAFEGLSQEEVRGEVADSGELPKAYRDCAYIARRHSRTFFLASGLLPPQKRDAARVLYAFCRRSDDLVDQPGADPEQALRDWQKRATGSAHPAGDLVALAWADVRARYSIPTTYVRQLIDGIRQDLSVNRYMDFNDLACYAYRVASTVGLMSMHIIGYASDAAIPAAVKMGVALQLTNILRDVAEDWQAGRLYLPADELSAYGLTEADIAAGSLSPAWKAFMAFQIERTRRLYREAWPGIAFLNPDGKLAIGAAAKLYEAILEDIESHEYDVFSRRAGVSDRRKIGMIPGIWRQVRRF